MKYVKDVSAVKEELGVPPMASACHTTTIGPYVIEGHVPVEAIERLLDERPDIQGIALSGMPSGSPGMFGTQTEPFAVLAFENGELSPFGLY